MKNELAAWALDEISQGDFAKAYRICRANYHEKMQTERIGADAWGEYRKALVDLEIARSQFNDATEPKYIDAAIQKFNLAQKWVELCKKAIRKGASRKSSNP